VLAIPVLTVIAAAVVSWHGADTVAGVLIPVVSFGAVFWLAVASAKGRVFGVDSPVLTVWADFNVADALSGSGIPVGTFSAVSWFNDTVTDGFVENLSDSALFAGNSVGALAGAFLSIKIINIIFIGGAIDKLAFASAIFGVPVSTGSTVDWAADTLAFDVVPVEVVWADLGAAFALAGVVVEDFVVSALDSVANALASFNVEEFTGSALVASEGWVAFAFAVGGREVLANWARICIVGWIVAEALALFGVEVESGSALLRTAKAVTSLSVEVVCRVLTLRVHAFALAGIEVELLTHWALKWLATAGAQIVIEVWGRSWAVSTDTALACAISNGPLFVSLANFWLALAIARIAIPEVLLSSQFVVRAFLIVDTLAFAAVVVPDKVRKALSLFADAVSSGHIEDLVLAWAVLW
jgi:hypothetical protein